MFSFKKIEFCTLNLNDLENCAVSTLFPGYHIDYIKGNIFF